MRHVSIAVVCLVAGMLSGCATGDFLGGVNLISEDRELSLGHEVGAELEKEMVIVDDPEIQAYVSGIGKKLVAASQSQDKPFQFFVVKEDEVNAFAIPGWRLYVHTGLIEAADSEAELAAVMAHEIGHAERRHGTQNLTRSMGTQILLGVAFGNSETDAAKIANGIANAGLLSYSRSAEREADDIAVHLLHRTGYDPNALVVFFDKLQSMGSSQSSAFAKLFSTHPPTSERIQNAKTLIGQLEKKGYTLGDMEKFHNFQAKIKEM